MRPSLIFTIILAAAAIVVSLPCVGLCDEVCPTPPIAGAPAAAPSVRVQAQTITEFGGTCTPSATYPSPTARGVSTHRRSSTTLWPPEAGRKT